MSTHRHLAHALMPALILHPREMPALIAVVAASETEIKFLHRHQAHPMMPVLILEPRQIPALIIVATNY